MAGAGTFLAALAPRIARARNVSKLPIIATEETFATTEYIEAYLKFAETSPLAGVQYARMFMSNPAMAKRLTDIDVRIADMDQAGVDKHLMSLVSPGVQVFDPDTATRLAISVNNEMAAIIRQHPDRLCGLAAVAPQDPVRGGQEIDRAISQLGLNGIIINSHTNGEFLDDPKFWPIFDAAVRNRAAIYLHPTFPAEAMIKPYEKYQMQGAIFGFAAEAGLHATRMILGGVFDHYPDLQIVLGHGGEGLPYWLFRLDDMQKKLMSMKAPGVVALKRLPSEYFRSNIYITTSGMFWNPVLDLCVKAVGADRVLFAIDYPFQQSKMAADFMRDAPLSKAEKRKIAYGNAQKVFKIS